MTSRWVPPTARASFVSQTYMGGMIGIVTSFPIFGLLIVSLGWESCFYIMATPGLVWCVFWAFFAVDWPHQHPSIQEEELRELTEIPKHTKLPVPWRSIIKSLPLWATLCTDVANSFGLITLLKMGPTFMKYMLGLDIKTNGLLSAAPMLARYLGGIVLCRLADWMVRSSYLSLQSCRRLFNTVSQICPGMAMVLMSYSGCSPTTAAILMVTGMFFNGAISAGHMASAVDLAPNYAGTLFGITNTISGGFTGVLAPLVIGAITSNNHTWVAWRTVFWMAGGIYTGGSLIYLVFIQAKPQSWNEPKGDGIANS